MKFGKNITIYAIADLLGRSIGLLVSPITTRLLTPEQYGAIPLLTAVWSVVALLQYAGMDWSYPFFKAQDKGNNQWKDILITSTVIATTSFIIIWIIFALVVLLSPILTNYANVTKFELLIFLLGLIPTVLTRWYLYILRFMHKAYSFARISLIGRIGSAIIALPLMFIVTQDNRLIVKFATIFIVNFIALFFAFWEFKKLNIRLYSKRFFSFVLGKKMFTYGIFLVPGGVIYSLFSVSDRILVGWISGTEEVAILFLGVSIGSLILIIKGWLSLVWDPHLVEWISTKNPNIYLPKLQLAIIIFSIIFFPIVCLSAVWSDFFVNLLYPTYYKPAAELIPYMIFAGSFSVLSLVGVSTVMIANTPKFHLPIYGIGLVVNIIIGVITIPKFGALGAVIGTLSAEIIILIGWITLGKFILKNLHLNWMITIIIGCLILVFIVFYKPGIILPDELILDRLFISTIIIGIFTYLVIRNKLFTCIRQNFL